MADMIKASYATVLDELMNDYDYEYNEETGEEDKVRGENAMTAEEAKALIERHRGLLERGISLLSNACYVARQIRVAEEARIK